MTAPWEAGYEDKVCSECGALFGGDWTSPASFPCPECCHLLWIWVDGPDSEAARAGRGKGHGLAMRVTPIEADTIRVCLEQPELDYAREKWGLDALADRFREHFWRNR